MMTNQMVPAERGQPLIELIGLLRNGAATAANDRLRRRAISIARALWGAEIAQEVGVRLWGFLAEARYQRLREEQIRAARAARELRLYHHRSAAVAEAPQRRAAATQRYAEGLRALGLDAEWVGPLSGDLRVAVPERGAAKKAWEEAVRAALTRAGFVPPGDLTLWSGSEAGWFWLGWTTGLTKPEGSVEPYEVTHARPWAVVVEDPTVQAARAAWKAAERGGEVLEEHYKGWRENRWGGIPALPPAWETLWRAWSAALQEIRDWEVALPEETGLVLWAC